jgi:hypothetical protein
MLFSSLSTPLYYQMIDSFPTETLFASITKV